MNRIVSLHPVQHIQRGDNICNYLLCDGINNLEYVMQRLINDF